MKTIYTALPIYDAIAKQAYQRALKAGAHDAIFSVYCPLDNLPPFQWLDNGDGASSVSTIELNDRDGNSTDITGSLTIAVETMTNETYFLCNGALSSSITCGLGYLKITTNNAKVYYSDWFNACDVTGFLMFEVYNECDLGNILYQTGFTQKAWIKSETMETSFPIEEEGVKNGEGRFIRTFARQTKKYSVKTVQVPSYMVDFFNRAIFHDNIFLTDTVGDINEVMNLEVSHEWFENDRYYALITLTFDYDETFVISGCCNNFI
jgi:hypothetical protein